LLVIHFKRFTADNQKISVKIPLADSLSLSSLGLVSDDAEEKHDGMYRLCGVIHHHGKTVHNGHYTACALRRLRYGDDDDDVKDVWVLLDDLKCKKTTLDYATGNAHEVNQKDCYMVVYELESDEEGDDMEE
jgi:ubiquitin C-terminal hydrolase